jgi:uncharacterized protein (TIGR02271 family)
VDQDTLDFQRGAPVVAPEGEVGRLAHVVVDGSGAASHVVVDRADGRWLVPIDAIVTADGERVVMRGGWYDSEPELFAPHEFNGAGDGLVLQARGGGSVVETPMAPVATPETERTVRMESPVDSLIAPDRPEEHAVAALESAPMPTDEPPPHPAPVAWAAPIDGSAAAPAAAAPPPPSRRAPPAPVMSAPLAPPPVQAPVEAAPPIPRLETAPMPADEPPPHPVPVPWAESVTGGPALTAAPTTGAPMAPPPPVAAPMPPMAPAVSSAPTTLPDRMELREEQLIPRVESVTAGVVRVGKDVVSEHKTIEVPVEHEVVVVERRPIEGVSPAPGPVEERTIEVVVHAERVIVDKVPIVREEVRVGKQVVPEVATVDATARKERAVVEVEGDVEVNDRV